MIPRTTPAPRTALNHERLKTDGREPICKVLPIAPPTYHERVAQRHDPMRLSARARRDLALRVEVRRVFDVNYRVYGVQGLAAAAA